jgi:uncharacterized protein (TIGR03435 family)
LKNAGPNVRSSCRKTVAAGGLTFTCFNTTMVQLSEKARDLTGDYPTLPVADLTGLSGSFDFAVTWSPSQRQTPGSAQSTETIPAEPVATASLPTGEVTFQEALEKQLGLKLTRKKLPMPVMVIDHVELPAQN